MAGFIAKDALDPFPYDLAPYADAKGSVPEPSDELVRAFYAGLGNALEGALGKDRLEGIDLTEPDEVRKLMGQLTEDDLKAMQGQMLDLHAAVCDGSPSREELEALPYRLKQHFYGMLQAWLSPEGSRLATKE